LLRRKQDQLARARRLGEAGSEAERALLDEIETLRGGIEKDVESIRASRGSPARRVKAAALQAPPWDLVNELDDRLPFLLLPVRIETRFMTVEGRRELWVRIFPDDIAVQTHEKNLTGDEMEAGKSYWRENWRARQESGEESRRVIEKGAWRVLARLTAGTRRLDRAPDPPATLNARCGRFAVPGVPEETLKLRAGARRRVRRSCPTASWSWAFEERKCSARRSSDPQPAYGRAGSAGGRVELGRRAANCWWGGRHRLDIRLQKAVELGMGLRVELATLRRSGLSQLLCAWIAPPQPKKKSWALVEELFENHSYSPDGLSFVRRTPPTTRTARARISRRSGADQLRRRDRGRF
jgi:hypothetical protein